MPTPRPDKLLAVDEGDAESALDTLDAAEEEESGPSRRKTSRRTLRRLRAIRRED